MIHQHFLGILFRIIKNSIKKIFIFVKNEYHRKKKDALIFQTASFILLDKCHNAPIYQDIQIFYHDQPTQESQAHQEPIEKASITSIFSEKTTKTSQKHGMEKGTSRALLLGSELFAGLVTSFALVWGIAHILNLSYLVRGIFGIILATAVNTLSLYRMRNR